MALTKKARSFTGATVLAIATVTALAGCGAAPWTTAASTPVVTPSFTPTPVATTPAPVVVIPNDLVNGFTTHTVKAGNISVVINYNSTLTMDKWLAGANKPVTVSLTAKFPGPKKQKVYLSQITMTTGVDGPDGPLLAPAPVVEKPSQTPGLYVKSPYTYGNTFILPAVDAAATGVTLDFKIELLLQTTPTSKSYAQQTATDTLTVAIAQPAGN